MLPEIVQFKQSPAEVRLYDALRDFLPDDFTVLHHVQWLQKRPRGPARDGEIDFLVAHPTAGALAIEVKGGTVRYDANSGSWSSTSRAGTEARLKDPFEQGKSACYSIMRYLEQLPGWPAGWGPIGYAVAFPDGRFDSRPLPRTPQEIVLDERHLTSDGTLREWVGGAFDYWNAETPRSSGIQGRRLLIQSLAHDLEIRQPLSMVVDRAEREFLRLSEQQFGVLNQLAGNRRVAISGPAGSGKTLIAMEKASRLAREGLRVLFVCFNRPLADHLRVLPVVRESGRLEVQTFHQLCAKLASEAGIQRAPGVEDRTRYEELEGALTIAADLLGPRFDAIVADEGQDFSADWWLPLQMLLEDPDRGIFFVFYDDNQAIYARPQGLPDGMFQLRLWENWRNTRQIHETLLPYYSGGDVGCRGPEGPPVEHVSVLPGELSKELGHVLHRLVAEEGIKVPDVVVLSPRAMGKSGTLGPASKFVVTEDPRHPHHVRASSVYRFKGLESAVVILCEMEGFSGPELKQLMYVACSRPRALLVILSEGPRLSVDSEDLSKQVAGGAP